MTRKLSDEEKAARKAARSRRTEADRDRRAAADQAAEVERAAQRFNPRSTPRSVEKSLAESALTADEYGVAATRGFVGPPSEPKPMVEPPSAEYRKAVRAGPTVPVPGAYVPTEQEVEAERQRYARNARQRDSLDQWVDRDVDVDESLERWMGPDDEYADLADQLWDDGLDDRPEWDR